MNEIDDEKKGKSGKIFSGRNEKEKLEGENDTFFQFNALSDKNLIQIKLYEVAQRILHQLCLYL